MPRYSVNYVAIVHAHEVVDADSPEEAIKKIKRGDGEMDHMDWDRVHPDTEFEVTALVDGDQWESLNTDYPGDQVLARTCTEHDGLCTAEIGPSSPGGWSVTLVHRTRGGDVVTEAISEHADEAAAKQYGETAPMESLRLATEEETAAWLAGHVAIEGSRETDHGLLVPENFKLED